MTTLREAAQQALALIASARLCEVNSMSSRQEMLRFLIEATDILRAALAQEQAEPVAWRCACGANLYLDEYGHPASRAAPRYGKPQQAEPAQEPYTSERHFALREAYCIGAADAFWKARPGTKDDGRTIAFDAGFARGFDKGTCLAEQRLAALAQQAEPVEPVAIVRWNDIGHISWRTQVMLPDNTLLYAAPPQRKPLTEEEIESCRQQGYAHAGLSAPFDFGKAARAVERAVWEKNHE